MARKVNFFIFTIISAILALFLIKSVSQGKDFCLEKSYELYKKYYMSEDGRIIDAQRKNVSTSEGQAYMLLRSVLNNDRKTFDLVLEWTKNNLKRDDYLYSWLWGENEYGSYLVLDDNPASDADVDIATALILAHEKWKNDEYIETAKPLINAIWEKETRKIDGRVVLMPGVAQVISEKIEINPSYFSPYAFKLFSKYDSKHDWSKLVDSSYYYIEASSNRNLLLPPDWFLIKDGKIFFEGSPRDDFSYDAIRVFPRVFLDYQLTGDKRALPVLKRVKFFISKWKDTQKMYVNYKSNGELKDKNEFVGSIALLLPVIDMFDHKVAMQIYRDKLMPKFDDANYWKGKNDYYGKNLTWFGCYLWDLQKNVNK